MTNTEEAFGKEGQNKWVTNKNQKSNSLFSVTFPGLTILYREARFGAGFVAPFMSRHGPAFCLLPQQRICIFPGRISDVL